MINRVPLFLAVGLFFITMYGLFFIKEKVVLMKSELSEVKRQIKLERDSIHILRAELAYLSAPERLSKLNDNYLKLRTTTTKQIVSAFGVEQNDDDKQNFRSAKKVMTASLSNSNVKWRFKKGPDKYVTRVAGRN